MSDRKKVSLPDLFKIVANYEFEELLSLLGE